jgi:hypothetical protein
VEKLSVNHSCGDSALKCVDCSGQVCPKCFVQCAVGNRCKKCASRFTSHVLKASPALLVRVGLSMAAVGVAYGFAARHLVYMPLGIYGYAIEFFVFMALGKVMHRVASYKMGAKVMGAAFLGLLLGLAIGPFRALVIAALGTANEDGTGGGGDYAINQYLVNLAILAFGLLSPYFRK